MKLNLTTAVNTTKNVITANSPVLLVGATITGVVATGILAAKGGYRARGIIDAEKAVRTAANDERPITPVEHAQLTWLCYAAPAVTGATSIASVLGLHSVHSKRNAAIASLYAVTTTKLDEFRKETDELLGPKKTQEVNNTLAQQAIDRNPLTGDHEVIVTGVGHELCYDEWGGRYFEGSVQSIEAAFDKLNLQLMEAGDANVNEFYDLIGLGPTQVGKQMGWVGQRIQPRFGSGLTKDQRSTIVFWFQQEPKDLSRN